jgi:ferredoxin-NADP reductase/MOSC domain-containing protein YiiM
MMRVVAVSRATPRWQQMHGRPVFTSIVRQKLEGPLHFGPDGPASNETANHTEQVLAFSAEHYDHWSTIFGIERSAWDWCHWGENLTVSGLDENWLRIGDILRIGATAVFQVTAPRSPCFKLAWRIGQPDQVLRSLTESGWIGFYLKMIAPGWVAAGDPILREQPYPDSLTVGDLARLLIDAKSDNIDALQRALATPALGSQAAGTIRHRVSQLRDGRRGRRERWQGWRPFTVSAVTEEACAIRSFHLRPCDGGTVPPYRAGQFLAVRLPPEAGGAVRCWSLSDYDEEDGDGYRLTIKRTAPDGASAWMHRFAEPGVQLMLRAPAGRFVLERGSFFRAVLISAGIGMTPLLAMLKAHAARGPQAPPLLWLHCTRSGRTHSLRGEIDRLIAANPNFRQMITYSAPDPHDRLGVDYHHAGRLTPATLTALVTAPQRIAPFGRSIELGGEHSDFYLCGPPDFETMVRAVLAAAGVAPANIRTESFGATAARALTEPVVESAQVQFRRSGANGQWRAEQDLTLLEFAEQLGLAPEFGCRMGNCQSCETAILEGAVVYDPDPVASAAPGRVLLCCARPKTALLVLDL